MPIKKASISDSCSCLFEQRGACTFGMNLEPCAPVIQVIDPMRCPGDDLIAKAERTIANRKTRSWKSYRHTQYGVV